MFHIYNRHYKTNGWMFPLKKSILNVLPIYIKFQETIWGLMSSFKSRFTLYKILDIVKEINCRFYHILSNVYLAEPHKIKPRLRLRMYY